MVIAMWGFKCRSYFFYGPKHYRHIFELTRLNEVIRIREIEAEALAAVD